jgi:hypothetical protein
MLLRFLHEACICFCCCWRCSFTSKGCPDTHKHRDCPARAQTTAGGTALIKRTGPACLPDACMGAQCQRQQPPWWICAFSSDSNACFHCSLDGLLCQLKALLTRITALGTSMLANSFTTDTRSLPKSPTNSVKSYSSSSSSGC